MLSLVTATATLISRPPPSRPLTIAKRVNEFQKIKYREKQASEKEQADTSDRVERCCLQMKVRVRQSSDLNCGGISETQTNGRSETFSLLPPPPTPPQPPPPPHPLPSFFVSFFFPLFPSFVHGGGGGGGGVVIFRSFFLFLVYLFVVVVSLLTSFVLFSFFLSFLFFFLSVPLSRNGCSFFLFFWQSKLLLSNAT